MQKSHVYKTLLVLCLSALMLPAISMANEEAAEKMKDKETKKGPSPAILEKYDADKDGMLSKEETAVMKADKEAAKAEWMKMADADGDGIVSAAEKDTLKAAEKEAKMKAKAEMKDKTTHKGEKEMEKKNE